MACDTYGIISNYAPVMQLCCVCVGGGDLDKIQTGYVPRAAKVVSNVLPYHTN